MEAKEGISGESPSHPS